MRYSTYRPEPARPQDNTRFLFEEAPDLISWLDGEIEDLLLILVRPEQKV